LDNATDAVVSRYFEISVFRILQLLIIAVRLTQFQRWKRMWRFKSSAPKAHLNVHKWRAINPIIIIIIRIILVLQHKAAGIR